MALFLVNLPFAHQAYTDHQINSSGREVEARLLGSRTVEGDHLVEYRLPRAVDPSRTRYSARVDATTYAQARESKVLLVRVVPGKPSANRPVGEIDNALFAVVAISADVVLLVVGVLLWRRWRRSSLHEVVAVAGDRGHPGLPRPHDHRRRPRGLDRPGAARRAGRRFVAPRGRGRRAARPTSQWPRAGARFGVRRARAGGGSPRRPGRAGARRRASGWPSRPVPTRSAPTSATRPRCAAPSASPRPASRRPAAMGDPPHRFTFATLLSRNFTSPTVV